MHIDPTRQKEIAEAEAKVARLEAARLNSEMSDSWYFSNGRAAKDKAEIAKAKAELAALKKDQ